MSAAFFRLSGMALRPRRLVFRIVFVLAAGVGLGALQGCETMVEAGLGVMVALDDLFPPTQNCAGSPRLSGASVYAPVDPSLWPVKTLDIQSPPGSTRLRLLNISSDGRVIVGARQDERTQRFIAVRWSAQNGVKDIVIPGAKDSEAGLISDDDSVIGGMFQANGANDDPSSNLYGFVWTEKGGLQIYGEKNWKKAELIGMADDGSLAVDNFWIAEYADLPDFYYSPHAFYWTKQDGVRTLVDGKILQTIGFTPERAVVYGVSSDGSIIVGWAKAPSGKWVIFLWNRIRDDVQIIARGDEYWSQLEKGMMVSSDESVLTGNEENSISRWTKQGGMTNPMPCVSIAGLIGVSSDGSKEVGTYNAANQRRLFVWTEKTGARDAGLYDPDSYYLVNDQTIFKIRIHDAQPDSSVDAASTGSAGDE